jgi:phenylalanyl-tRNA synthetase alpha subunit
MTEIAESNRWYRGKGKLIRDHIDKQKMMNDLIASKGFCIAPGYLGEAITDLEENTKIRLSELNYEIVKEAIERELKQKGIDYDLAYKEARIDFELSKTVLLTDLQKEFADLDYRQAKKEEETEYLAIEAHIRSFTLIVLKQAIREEMEALKQELMNVKRLTFNQENLLLEARIATAETKLGVIP